MTRKEFLRKAFQCLGIALVIILVGGGLVLTIFWIIFWIIYGSISAWGAVGLAILFFLLMFMVLYTIFEQRLKEWWSRLPRTVQLVALGVKTLFLGLFLLLYFLAFLILTLWIPIVMFVAYVILVIENFQMGRKLRDVEEKLKALQVQGEFASEKTQRRDGIIEGE